MRFHNVKTYPFAKFIALILTLPHGDLLILFTTSFGFSLWLKNLFFIITSALLHYPISFLTPKRFSHFFRDEKYWWGRLTTFEI